MNLPIYLYQFWCPNAFHFFMRFWHNTMLLLEEDLAVGLMWQLLFVPLFHDSSFVGKCVSLLFRLTRITTGLFAYAFVSFLIAFVAFIWFLAPILILLPLTFILGIWNAQFPFIFFLIESIAVTVAAIGCIIFTTLLLNRPLRRVQKIERNDQIWSSTHLSPSEITYEQLLKTPEVQEFLFLLEMRKNILPKWEIVSSEALISKTIELAKQLKAIFISPEHFFIASFLLSSNFQKELQKLALKESDLFDALKFQELKRNHYRKIYPWDEYFAIKHLKGVNRGWMSAPTPMLDAVSTDITKLASTQFIEDFIGRGSVLHEVITILSQSEDRNVLLVGSPGVGKSTLVHHLAKMIVAGDAPDALATKRVVELDINRLTSGITVQGELAQRLQQVFTEIEYSEDIVLFIDEIHNLGVGDVGSNFNLYGLISPFLESGKFQFIGSTEELNYSQIIQKNGSFVRLFHKVIVPPAPISDTLETIQMRAIDLWFKKGIASTYLGLKDLVFYADKLIHDRVLPDSAIAVFKECEPNAQSTKVINTDLVKRVIEAKVSVPIVELDDSRKQILLNFETEIHKRLIDQEEAVKAVADTLRRASTSLREQTRPIGSFLFVGPTGVGKTELAKSISDLYFGTAQDDSRSKDESSFLRFDMSEYQTAESATRLIGSADKPGELTEAIKNKPYCLLLLDEFEKADPNLLTLFLQVLDDGRLTDYDGSHIDFTNTIIIATSNVASVQIAQSIEKHSTTAQLEEEVRSEIIKVLKPELMNRFDRIVIFKPLSEENLAKIVYFKLKDLSKMLEDQGFLVQFGDDVIKEIARKGYDPVLGARPMRRAIQDLIESKLSKMILNNELKKGELKHISLDFLE